MHDAPATLTPRSLWRAVARVLATASLLAAASATAADTTGNRPIADLSIEELMNVEVVSVSKKTQRLADSAAAVFVISADDIHRSGVTNLPEALRLAPGVNVGWIGGGAYSVTIRGFGGRFANKLLVLRDGRSLYTSFFAGVFWEKELPMLADVERIEVIRGPGAAVWGANAVNGVINIITRSSRDTVGGLAALEAGNDGYHEGAARYGVRLDEQSTLRLFGRGAQGQPGLDLTGASSPDVVRNASGGVRYDRGDGLSEVSLQAEAYRAYSSQHIQAPSTLPPFTVDASNSQTHEGGFALGRYERTLTEASSITLQAYFDHSRIDMPAFVTQSRDVVNLEFQNHVRLSPINDVVWGVGLRSDADSISGSPFVQFNPRGATRRTATLNAQDDVALLPDKLRLTLGAIVEADSIIGTHFIPDARLIWSVTPASSIWAAASRAIRSPSRAELDVQYLLGPTIPAQPPNVPLEAIPVASGTPNFGPEKETAYQLGYRVQPTHNLSLDLTAFLSHYTDLRTDTLNPARATAAVLEGVPYLRLPIDIINGQTASSRGAELAVDWRVLAWWRVQASVSHLAITTDAATDVEGITANSPRNTLSLRSSMDISRTRFDLWLYHVDAIDVTRTTTANIPGYVTLDARLAWNPAANTEVAISGHNLINSDHVEYVSDNIITASRQTNRSAFVSIRLTF